MSDDKNSGDDHKHGQNGSSQDEGQVIQFPLERLKAQRKAKRLAEKNNQQKRVTLFLSVASVFVLAAYLNQNSQSELQNLVQKEGMERMVANSELSNDEISSKNQELGESLQESSLRRPASYGRKPSAMEKLKFEQLRGRYRLTHEQNYLMEISLDESGGVVQKPVHLGSTMKFLMKYREIIAPGFASAEFLGSEQSDSYNFERFSLLSEEGSEVGRVEFQYDLSGAFIRMLVQKDGLKFQE